MQVTPPDYMGSVQGFALIIGVAATATLVVSLAITKALYSIRASHLLRTDGARELANYGYFPHCAACGQKLSAGVGDKGTCPNCGHTGEVDWSQDLDERARIRSRIDWDASDREEDRRSFVAALTEQGLVFYCEACGAPVTEDEWDFEDTRCESCGHRGMPGQTDDPERVDD